VGREKKKSRAHSQTVKDFFWITKLFLSFSLSLFLSFSLSLTMMLQHREPLCRMFYKEDDKKEEEELLDGAAIAIVAQAARVCGAVTLGAWTRLIMSGEDTLLPRHPTTCPLLAITTKEPSFDGMCDSRVTQQMVHEKSSSQESIWANLIAPQLACPRGSDDEKRLLVWCSLSEQRSIPNFVALHCFRFTDGGGTLHIIELAEEAGVESLFGSLFAFLHTTGQKMDDTMLLAMDHSYRTIWSPLQVRFRQQLREARDNLPAFRACWDMPIQCMPNKVVYRFGGVVRAIVAGDATEAYFHGGSGSGNKRRGDIDMYVDAPISILLSQARINRCSATTDIVCRSKETFCQGGEKLEEEEHDNDDGQERKQQDDDGPVHPYLALVQEKERRKRARLAMFQYSCDEWVHTKTHKTCKLDIFHQPPLHNDRFFSRLDASCFDVNMMVECRNMVSMRLEYGRGRTDTFVGVDRLVTEALAHRHVLKQCLARECLPTSDAEIFDLRFVGSRSNDVSLVRFIHMTYVRGWTDRSSCTTDWLFDQIMREMCTIAREFKDLPDTSFTKFRLPKSYQTLALIFSPARAHDKLLLDMLKAQQSVGLFLLACLAGDAPSAKSLYIGLKHRSHMDFIVRVALYQLASNNRRRGGGGGGGGGGECDWCWGVLRSHCQFQSEVITVACFIRQADGMVLVGDKNKMPTTTRSNKTESLRDLSCAAASILVAGSHMDGISKCLVPWLHKQAKEREMEDKNLFLLVATHALKLALAQQQISLDHVKEFCEACALYADRQQIASEWRKLLLGQPYHGHNKSRLLVGRDNREEISLYFLNPESAWCAQTSVVADILLSPTPWAWTAHKNEIGEMSRTDSDWLIQRVLRSRPLHITYVADLLRLSPRALFERMCLLRKPTPVIHLHERWCVATLTLAAPPLLRHNSPLLAYAASFLASPVVQ